MTNEKRYELICNMLRAYDAISDGAMGAAEKVIKNPQTWQNSTYFPFYADAAKLLVEALEGMDKKTAGTGRAAAISRVYKSAAGGCRENLRGAFRSGDRWAICDGFRFIRLNSKPESIPECAGGIDLDRCIPEGARSSDVVNLPSVAEIKTAIADLKSRFGKGWKTHPIEAVPGWWCNPQYLLDMVQALPNGTAHAPKSPLSAMYYESEDGDAVILPVRTPVSAESAA